MSYKLKVHYRHGRDTISGKYDTLCRIFGDNLKMTDMPGNVTCISCYRKMRPADQKKNLRGIVINAAKLKKKKIKLGEKKLIDLTGSDLFNILCHALLCSRK